MDYTNSPNYADLAPDRRMHTNQYSPTTRVTDSDINGPVFEIMQVIEAAGLAPLAFDPYDPLSYSQLKLAIEQMVTTSVPAGLVCHFANTAMPTGWLQANGAAISRSVYASLFAAIGTTYGVGDGSTSFNLPDVRGEFLRGLDSGRGVDTGRVAGSAQAWATSAPQTPSGSTRVDGDAPQKSGGAARVPDASTLGFARAIGSDAGDLTGVAFIETQAALHYMDVFNVWAGDSETRPRNIAMLACIKY